MKSFRRWLMWSAALGLVAPIVWFLMLAFDGLSGWRFKVLLRLWPSSIWMMATDGIEDTPTAYIFIALAVLANLMLYSLVGMLAWFLFAPRHSRHGAERLSVWLALILWLLFVVLGVVLWNVVAG